MCVCVCVCVAVDRIPVVWCMFYALSIEDQDIYLHILESGYASREAESHFYHDECRDVLRVPGIREGE